MQWLLIVLAIIALIALVLLAVSVPRVTVEVHLKNQILDILIKTPFFRKKLHYDLLKKAEPKPEKKKSAEKKSSSGGDLKSKFADIKQRVFNPETGFDTDELKNVKDELIESYSSVMGIIRKIFSKLRYRIHIPYLRIRLEYGTNDPANTGMIYGSIWNLTGVVYPFLAKYFNIAYPILDITPDFYSKRFDIDVKSIIKVRPAHIINATIAGMFVPALTYLKDKIIKGREKND